MSEVQDTSDSVVEIKDLRGAQRPDENKRETIPLARMGKTKPETFTRADFYPRRFH